MNVVLYVLFVLASAFALGYALLSYDRMQQLRGDAATTTMPRFGTTFRFDESLYASKVDVENLYDCNAESLRKCLIDDATTLFGCRELTARCHHFAEDTRLEGTDRVIPRNESPNEGYALAIQSVVKLCNPYHGDLVLVAVDDESRDYMLVCQCKNPGYIGNDSLLGDCTTVRICDGRIDDLQQPLERINCKCANSETSVRYSDGLPVCKKLLVKEANELYPNGWEHLVPWRDKSVFVSTSLYARYVRDNLRTRRLLNPCVHSLLRPTEEIAYTTSYLSANKGCYCAGDGLPVNVGILDPPNNGYATVDAIVPTDGTWRFLRFSDKISGNRRLSAVGATVRFMNRAIRGVFENPVGLRVGRYLSLFIDSPVKYFMSGKCSGYFPSYSCSLAAYGSDARSAELRGMPCGGYRDCPSEFLFNREYWHWSEDCGSYGIQGGPDGLSLDNKRVHIDRKFRFYGIVYAARNAPEVLSGLASFKSDDDYVTHLRVLT